MFPLLPILILLLMGPANAERLAAEGRLPAGLLAIHLAHVAPVRATVVAPIRESERNAARSSGKRPLVAPSVPLLRAPSSADGFESGWPTRAGPVAV